MPAKKKVDEEKEPEVVVSIEPDRDSRTAQINITGKFDSEGVIGLYKQLGRVQQEIC